MKKRTNDLINKLLEEIDRPIFIKNEVGVYIACNASFEKFFGVNRERILGQTAFAIAPASLANIYTDADKELFARRTVQIYKAPAIQNVQNLETVVFHKTIFFDADDQVAGFIGAIDNKKSPAPLNKLKINCQSHGLTRRELEVLHLMSQGLSSKESAKILQISHHTMADYFKSIYVKLGVNNRVSAIVAAQKLQLI